MKRYKAIGSVAVAMIVVGIAGICFGVTGSGEDNKFQSGGINIQVDVSTLRERVLTSTDDIPYVPHIENKAEEAFVRGKIEVGDENITSSCLGVPPGWVKKGEYLYLKTPLKKDEGIDVCRKLSISKQVERLNSFSITMTAECVQAKNFNPDFNCDSPWGNLEPEVSHVGKSYSFCKGLTGEPNGIETVFEGKISKKVKGKEDFFSGPGNLMPGDVYEDSLTFEAAGSEEIFFKAKCDDSKLSNKILLTVTANGREYYSGSLSSERISNYEKILNLNGKDEVVNFRLEVPTELRDDYQELTGQVTFFFKSSNSGKGSGVGGGVVKTGDRYMIVPTAVFLFLSGIAVFGEALRRKERR